MNNKLKLIFVSFIVVIGCKTIAHSPYESATHKNLASGIKLEVFRNCISDSYTRKGNDLSFNNDFLYGHTLYQLIDSLGKNIQKEIVHDSIINLLAQCPDCSKMEIERDTNYLKMLHSEGMIGKRTIKFCIDYYQSKELDSIAIEATRDFSKKFK